MSDPYWLTDEQMVRLRPNYQRAMASRELTTGGC